MGFEEMLKESCRLNSWTDKLGFQKQSRNVTVREKSWFTRGENV